VVDLHAGAEVAVAATKSYTAQLTALAMLSAAMAGEADMFSALDRLPELARHALDNEGRLEPIAASFRDADRCIVLGRGFNLSTAFEWALKLQELAGVVAQPFSAADFEHGPIAVVGPGFPVLAVSPTGPLSDAMDALLLRLREDRGARLFVLSGSQPSTDDPHRVALPPDIPEWLSPIPAIVSAQLFTYHLTAAKGLDPDRPRGLRKVTRTL
jgi:glucosamine--fructose-6-phosphate aminotransferase (isomerizing)